MGTFLKFISTLILISFNLNFLFPLYSNELYANKKESELIKNLETDLYLLGPGDNLKIILDEELDTQIKRIILNDGTVNLPYVGSIYLNNLSLKEAEAKIEKELSKELIKFDITLSLIEARNIAVIIIGEINNPGIYNKNNNLNNNSTFIDAIRLAGGFSPEANIDNITLKRKMPGINKFKVRTINLIKLLKDGDLNQNPYLFDGDVIKIKKVKNIKSQEYNEIANSNLSGEIKVNIIGEVTQPGEYNLTSDTPINHAILFAGGFTARANKNFVKLVRLRDNGTILSKKYNYNLDSNRSSKENPALRDKDVLIVTTNAYNKLGDTLNNALTPLNPIIKGVRIYTLLD